MNPPARFSGQREILWDKFVPFLDIGVTLLQLSEFIEPFAEAESAPIRSAVQFYFDIDVRIFVQLFFDRSKT